MRGAYCQPDEDRTAPSGGLACRRGDLRRGDRNGKRDLRDGGARLGDWDARHLDAHRFAAWAAEGLVGWAALSPYSSRPCYAGVAEVSIYVAGAAQARGVGRALLEALVTSCRAGGLWTLQAGIFPENEASLALHRGAGFREVGVRERLGQLDGVWRDVVLLELRL